MNRSVTITALLICVPAAASGQSSRDYALMARAASSAFECSQIAALADNDDSERLFKFGYEQGQKFMSALKGGKIDDKDLQNEVPLLIHYFVLYGPTPDFILGRLYESVSERVRAEVTMSGGSLNSQETQRIIARNRFAELNCALLGR